MLSMEEGCGKSYVSESIEVYWKKLGLNVRKLTDGIDFQSESSEFQLANGIHELYIPGNEDILIVEYPPMSNSNVPTPLLREAQLNLMVVSANYGWKATDRIMLQKLEAQLGAKPYLCLNRAPKYDVENYTGMLPPYTPLRKVMYLLSQLALTENAIHWKDVWKRKKEPRTGVAEEDDDD